MPKKGYILFVLATIFLSACGGNLDSPPLVYLVRNGNLIDGFQSSYCWDQGIGGTICVDTMEPYFEETIRWPSGGPLRFQFDTPLPDLVTLSFSEELFGKTILSESISPAEMIAWSPVVPPGEYIITVHTSWKQGEVTYWFSVNLE